jgi:ABC-type phosphate transport system auxiliary subunit
MRNDCDSNESNNIKLINQNLNATRIAERKVQLSADQARMANKNSIIFLGDCEMPITKSETQLNSKRNPKLVSNYVKKGKYAATN